MNDLDEDKYLLHTYLIQSVCYIFKMFVVYLIISYTYFFTCFLKKLTFFPCDLFLGQVYEFIFLVIV